MHPHTNPSTTTFVSVSVLTLRPLEELRPRSFSFHIVIKYNSICTKFITTKYTTIYDYCNTYPLILLQVKLRIHAIRNVRSKYNSWRLMVTYVIVNQPNDRHHGCLGWVMRIQNKPHTTTHQMLYVIFLWDLRKRLILNYNYKVLCAVCVVLQESYALWWLADYPRNTRLDRRGVVMAGRRSE